MTDTLTDHVQQAEPRQIAITGFMLVEEDVDGLSCCSIRLNVGAHQQLQGRGKAAGLGPAVAEGTVDADVVPTSDLKQCMWRDEQLWIAFWAACLNNVQPHRQPHKYDRFTHSKRHHQTDGASRVMNGTPVWHVYEIVDFKMAYGRPAFNVAWVDYPDEENTWEPLRSLKQPLHTFNWAALEPWQRCCNAMAAGKPQLMPGAPEKDRPLPPPRGKGLYQQPHTRHSPRKPPQPPQPPFPPAPPPPQLAAPGAAAGRPARAAGSETTHSGFQAGGGLPVRSSSRRRLREGAFASEDGAQEQQQQQQQPENSQDGVSQRAGQAKRARRSQLSQDAAGGRRAVGGSEQGDEPMHEGQVGASGAEAGAMAEQVVEEGEEEHSRGNGDSLSGHARGGSHSKNGSRGARGDKEGSRSQDGRVGKGVRGSRSRKEGGQGRWGASVVQLSPSQRGHDVREGGEGENAGAMVVYQNGGGAGTLVEGQAGSSDDDDNSSDDDGQILDPVAIWQQVEMNALALCDAFRDRFRAKFHCCKHDGYFIYYKRMTVRKYSSKLESNPVVERASAKLTSQLMQPVEEVNAGMEVYTLEDPCDPCYNNPYVKGDMSEKQKGVRAAKPLAKGDVAGIYQGRLITRADHNQFTPRDKWDLDTPEHAYTMPLAWSEGDEGEFALLLQGDNNGRCPTVFVNHEAFWGSCWRQNAGVPCHCSLYQSRKANLDIKHGFKMEDGKLIPKTWMQARRNIAAGEVLLTEWDMSHLTETGNAYVRAKLYDSCQAAAERMAVLRRKLVEAGIDPGDYWSPCKLTSHLFAIDSPPHAPQPLQLGYQQEQQQQQQKQQQEHRHRPQPVPLLTLGPMEEERGDMNTDGAVNGTAGHANGEGVGAGVGAEGEDFQGNALAGQGGEGGVQGQASASCIHGLQGEMVNSCANGHDACAAAVGVGERGVNGDGESRPANGDVGRAKGSGGPGVSQKRNSRGGMVLNGGGSRGAPAGAAGPSHIGPSASTRATAAAAAAEAAAAANSLIQGQHTAHVESAQGQHAAQLPSAPALVQGVRQGLGKGVLLGLPNGHAPHRPVAANTVAPVFATTSETSAQIAAAAAAAEARAATDTSAQIAAAAAFADARARKINTTEAATAAAADVRAAAETSVQITAAAAAAETRAAAETGAGGVAEKDEEETWSNKRPRRHSAGVGTKGDDSSRGPHGGSRLKGGGPGDGGNNANGGGGANGGQRGTDQGNGSRANDEREPERGGGAGMGGSAGQEGGRGRGARDWCVQMGAGEADRVGEGGERGLGGGVSQQEHHLLRGSGRARSQEPGRGQSQTRKRRGQRRPDWMQEGVENGHAQGQPYAYHASQHLPRHGESNVEWIIREIRTHPDPDYALLAYKTTIENIKDTPSLSFAKKKSRQESIRNLANVLLRYGRAMPDSEEEQARSGLAALVGDAEKHWRSLYRRDVRSAEFQEEPLPVPAVKGMLTRTSLRGRQATAHAGVVPTTRGKGVLVGSGGDQAVGGAELGVWPGSGRRAKAGNKRAKQHTRDLEQQLMAQQLVEQQLRNVTSEEHDGLLQILEPRHHHQPAPPPLTQLHKHKEPHEFRGSASPRNARAQEVLEPHPSQQAHGDEDCRRCVQQSHAQQSQAQQAHVQPSQGEEDRPRHAQQQTAQQLQPARQVDDATQARGQAMCTEEGSPLSSEQLYPQPPLQQQQQQQQPTHNQGPAAETTKGLTAHNVHQQHHQKPTTQPPSSQQQNHHQHHQQHSQASLPQHTSPQPRQQPPQPRQQSGSKGVGAGVPQRLGSSLTN